MHLVWSLCFTNVLRTFEKRPKGSNKFSNCEYFSFFSPIYQLSLSLSPLSSVQGFVCVTDLYHFDFVTAEKNSKTGASHRWRFVVCGKNVFAIRMENLLETIQMLIDDITHNLTKTPSVQSSLAQHFILYLYFEFRSMWNV